MRQISRGKFNRLQRTTAGFTTSALDGYGLRVHWPARPAPYASYPVLVHRLASLLHASFRPRLATTPLRFANPSPPSGWVEDFHLQAVEHARHTKKSAGPNGPAPIMRKSRLPLRACRMGRYSPMLSATFTPGYIGVAQVIHAIDLDHINILRIEPVARPRIHESERIAAVLEAVIPVVALADTKRVLLSKIGLESVVGNAATAGMLRLLFRLGLRCAAVRFLPARSSCCCCAFLLRA